MGIPLFLFYGEVSEVNVFPAAKRTDLLFCCKNIKPIICMLILLYIVPWASHILCTCPYNLNSGATKLWGNYITTYIPLHHSDHLTQNSNGRGWGLIFVKHSLHAYYDLLSHHSDTVSSRNPALLKWSIIPLAFQFLTHHQTQHAVTWAVDKWHTNIHTLGCRCRRMGRVVEASRRWASKHKRKECSEEGREGGI